MKKKLKILYVYIYATYGGCERVILNRAECFINNDDIEIDVYFIKDLGGLKPFKEYIKNNNLDHILNIVNSPNYDTYDYIFSIDTPEIFNICPKKLHNKIFIECHTPYLENRKYLKKLPSNIKGIIVPSEPFRKIILPEILDCHKDKLFVIDDIVRINEEILPNFKHKYALTPIIFLGRLDSLKNPNELLKIVKLANDKLNDKFLLILVGNQKTDININDQIKKLNITGRVLLLPEIPFGSVNKLFHLIKINDGIFMSSSKGESFGLSAAEAIISGLPVLLSDIPCHKFLVQDNSKFYYQQGNIQDAVNKLKSIINNYSSLKKECNSLSDKLIKNNFVKSFNKLLNLVDKPNCDSFKNKVFDYYGISTSKNIKSALLNQYINYALSTVERGKSSILDFDNLIDLKDKRVLDIGCAYGGFLVAYAQGGAKEVIGIDINKKLLDCSNALIKDYNLDIKTYLIDISKKKEISSLGKFDIISCYDVIEHLTDHASAIHNISNLLKSKGSAILEIPNPNHYQNILKDPHYNLCGITLLSKFDADNYYLDETNNIGKNYVFYKDLFFYKKYFLKNNLSFKIVNDTLDEDIIDILNKYKNTYSLIEQQKFKNMTYGNKIIKYTYENLLKLEHLYQEYLEFKNSNNSKSEKISKYIKEYYGIQSWKIFCKKKV